MHSGHSGGPLCVGISTNDATNAALRLQSLLTQLFSKPERNVICQGKFYLSSLLENYHNFTACMSKYIELTLEYRKSEL